MITEADVLEMKADWLDARAELLEAVLSFGMGKGPNAAEVSELAKQAEGLFEQWKDADSSLNGTVYLFRKKAG
jgi:hypothetical protein